MPLQSPGAGRRELSGRKAATEPSSKNRAPWWPLGVDSELEMKLYTRRKLDGKGTTAVCAGCEKPFIRSRSGHATCSQRCQNVLNWAKRDRVELVCLICGTPFPRSHAGQKYCSDPCRAEHDRRRRRTGVGSGGTTKGKTLVPRVTCEVCSGEFYATPSRQIRGHARFCSRECHGRYVATHPDMFSQTRTRRGNGGKRADLDNLYVRSAWEANWARYLNWLVSLGAVIEWAYEPETFEFPIKRGSRFYTPDFRVQLVDGSTEYHEIKGYMDQRSATKLKRMRKYHPKVKLVLIEKDDYYAVAHKVSGVIPYWEHRR